MSQYTAQLYFVAEHWIVILLMRKEPREEFQQHRETELIYSAQVEDVPLTVSTSCVHYKQQP